MKGKEKSNLNSFHYVCIVFLIFCADSNSPCNYVSVVANLASPSESFYKAIIIQGVTWLGTVSFLCK